MGANSAGRERSRRTTRVTRTFTNKLARLGAVGAPSKLEVPGSGRGVSAQRTSCPKTQRRHFTFKRPTAISVSALAATVLGVSFAVTNPAFAGNGTPTGGTHTQSLTLHFTGLVNDIGNGGPPPPDPCDATQTLTGAYTVNEIDHMTWFPNDPTQVWSTGTDVGTVNATSVPGPSTTGSAVTYTGHTTQWFGFNSNQNNGESGFTITVKATGSDGSTISFHGVDHFLFSGFDSSGNPIITRQTQFKSATCG